MTLCFSSVRRRLRPRNCKARSDLYKRDDYITHRLRHEKETQKINGVHQQGSLRLEVEEVEIGKTKTIHLQQAIVLLFHYWTSLDAMQMRWIPKGASSVHGRFAETALNVL